MLEELRGGYPECSKSRAGGVSRMLVENSPDSHNPVENHDLRAQGASRSGEALEVQTGPPKPLTGR